MNLKNYKCPEIKKSYVVTSLRRYVVNKKGFTLAEMLIVLILIGVLTAFGGRQYYAERDRFIYNNTLTKIVTIINTARNSAITSRGVAVGGQNFVPPSGFGVYINLAPGTGEPHFTLFASIGDHDGNSATLNTNYDKDVDQKLDSFRLPDKFHFQFFEFKPGGATAQDWNPQWTGTQGDIEYKATEAVIIFRPPLAETYIAGGLPPPELPKVLEDVGMRFYNPDRKSVV
jgi:prepilin-type N-terminal cleavage/methylation domain-containing protein